MDGQNPAFHSLWNWAFEVWDIEAKTCAVFAKIYL